MPTRDSSMRSSISAALCLMAWNVAIGRSNCTRTLAYSTARSNACCIDPSVSAHSSTAASSTTRFQISVWSPSGPTGSATTSVELEPGEPPGHVEAGIQLGPAVPRPGRCRCPAAVRARHEDPVGGVAVEHDRLGARAAATDPIFRDARVRMRSTTSPWPVLVDGDRAARRARRERRRAGRRDRGRAPPASPTRPRTGTARAAAADPSPRARPSSRAAPCRRRPAPPGRAVRPNRARPCVARARRCTASSSATMSRT